jgi:hypothetical protein
MKKNILDPAALAAITQRIKLLSPDSERLWGKMNVAQMLCHCGDQFRLALGDLKVAGDPPFLGRTLMRWLVLVGVPAPKGKVETMPELNQVKSGGTPSQGFEEDRKILIDLLDRFLATPESYAFQRHSIFGTMDKSTWGRMAYIHLHHHLQQFGV